MAVIILIAFASWVWGAHIGWQVCVGAMKKGWEEKNTELDGLYERLSILLSSLEKKLRETSVRGIQ